MATRETSKRAARRRAKTTNDRAAHARRAKASDVQDPQRTSAEGPRARGAEPTCVLSHFVAVDVLWAAVASSQAAAPATPTAGERAEADSTGEAAEAGSTGESAEADSTGEGAEAGSTDDAVRSDGGVTAQNGADAARSPEASCTPASDAAVRRRRIAERAYALAEASGFRLAPFDAWLRAERELEAA